MLKLRKLAKEQKTKRALKIKNGILKQTHDKKNNRKPITYN